MANVLFKRGLQNALPTSGLDGCFYLTTDTHRLYVGQDGAVVPVNEGIVTVDNVASLPSHTNPDATKAGNFYYATAENILCIYNGQKWVQLNPNTDTKISGVDVVLTNNADGSVNVNTKVSDTGGATKQDAYKLAGAGSVTVSSDDATSTVTITGKEYGLEVAADGTNASSVTLTGAGDKVKISGSSSIKVATDADNGNITLSVDEKGISGIKSVDFSPAGTDDKGTGFEVSITDGKDKKHTSTYSPTIKYGENGAETAEFVGGTATLDIYSKDDLDIKLRDLNSMRYMGTIGSNGSAIDGLTLPTTNVNIGNTYMAISNLDNIPTGGDPTTAKIGDLIIARSKTNAENVSTGFIDSANVIWDVIPSGDDIHKDTTYKGAAITNGLALKNDGGGQVAAIDFNSGNDAIVISNKPNAAGDSNTITVTHKTITDFTSTILPNDSYKQTAQRDFTLPVLAGISKDAYGHITGITTKDVLFTDTNASLTSVTSGVAASGNVATVTTTAVLTQAGGEAQTKAGTFNIASTNEHLTVTASTGGDAVNIDFVWGSF